MRPRRPPLTVDNPYFQPRAALEPAAEPNPAAKKTPAPAGGGAERAIAGRVADADRPAVYRLPSVLPLVDNPTLPEGAQRPAVEQPPPASLPLPLPPHSASRGLPERASLPESSPSELIPQLPPVAAPSGSGPLPAFAPRDPAAILYSPTATELSVQLLPAVRRGCALAQRGALFAARTEFIQVLRRIAQANDAERGTNAHSRSLADGLRALDEAGDYVPDGAGLEGEIEVRLVASSHRTPVLRDAASGYSQIENVLPREAVAMYHAFAQERLSAAVASQQAGSMALYSLGMINARLAEGNGDAHASQAAMTFYLAALAACPANHLAANELGVLLCRNGHAAEAARLFEQSIEFAPSATAYHNLAVAQEKLGLSAPAAASQRESDRLAAWERATGAVSRRAGVEWVSAEDFAQPVSGLAPAMPLASGGAPDPPPTPAVVGGSPAKWPWQKVIEVAKSITGRGDDAVHR
jgi:tetratricopeptide (TPR) repeat protein